MMISSSLRLASREFTARLISTCSNLESVGVQRFTGIGDQTPRKINMRDQAVSAHLRYFRSHLIDVQILGSNTCPAESQQTLVSSAADCPRS